MSFPYIPPGLITQLEKRFPDTVPRADVGPFVHGSLAGEQTVIDFLRAQEAKQEKNQHVHAPREGASR